jgi:cation:H+ antiporter
VLAAWLQFLFCSAAIAIAGYSLARYGDVIAEKTGLGGTWIGVILVATVTSLPELATGLSSVTVANAPDIAVGDVLGSCVFNLALIAVLDFLYRETPIYQKAGQVHILSAGFSVILIGIVVFSLLSGDAATLRLGHIGIYTPAILALYFVSVRAIFVQERRNAQTREATNRHANLSLTDAVVRYAMAAVIVVAAGIAMPFAAVRLANAMGWGQSFVGTLLVAAATSLPEAASTVGALRIRAIDLAIGNLLGSVDEAAIGPNATKLADVSHAYHPYDKRKYAETDASTVPLAYGPSRSVRTPCIDPILDFLDKRRSQERPAAWHLPNRSRRWNCAAKDDDEVGLMTAVAADDLRLNEAPSACRRAQEILLVVVAIERGKGWAMGAKIRIDSCPLLPRSD